MVWNLEERGMSLYHCALDGKAVNENTEEAQFRLMGMRMREVGRQEGEGGRGELGKYSSLMSGARLSNPQCGEMLLVSFQPHRDARTTE